ncbi:MAG: alkaline phosphatase family protein [Kiritimatiellae bacterium]|nr:alkaline phosphatase family protein [Kiritimatiellia bacterium]
MKNLKVIAAGLGWNLLERHNAVRMAGLEFSPADSVFPAVTCVAQATMRTGLDPIAHGMSSNGYWFKELVKPMFWEQSARLVKGERVWAKRREAGGTVGMYFFQQSMGESADSIITPAPIHKHGGGMAMSCYTKPTEASAEIEKKLGRFPLWRYWGPLASPKVGRVCIDWFEAMTELSDVDEAWLYLPSLDYKAQKCGPGSAADNAAFAEFRRQLERLADICQKRSCSLSVTGDYAITPVTAEPFLPNTILRRDGFFRTRQVGGRSYPDFFQSSAFALCDHEICLVYGEKREEAAKSLLSTGLCGQAAKVDARAITLIARKGSWCAYPWWTDRREAPDYASHVDIHNKPGFDPTELFFFGRGTVKGTHGRQCKVATAAQ